jgi:hypothetical protein
MNCYTSNVTILMQYTRQILWMRFKAGSFLLSIVIEDSLMVNDGAQFVPVENRRFPSQSNSSSE